MCRHARNELGSYDERWTYLVRSSNLTPDFFLVLLDVYSSGWQVKTRIWNLSAHSIMKARSQSIRDASLLNELVVEHDGASEGIGDG